MNTDVAYAIIKKVIEDSGYAQAFAADPDGLLLGEGIANPEEAGELKAVLGILLAARAKTAQEITELQAWLVHQRATTGKTADTFKTGLQRTIEQIDRGFNSTAVMYKVGFYLGIALIIVSVPFAVWKNQALLPLVFAGLGVADVIAFFITKPPQQLQQSRADLAQLQAVYYNWFIDNFNWNSFIGMAGSTGDLESVYRIMREVSTTMLENTARTMELIEKYCEFVETK